MCKGARGEVVCTNTVAYMCLRHPLLLWTFLHVQRILGIVLRQPCTQGMTWYLPQGTVPGHYSKQGVSKCQEDSLKNVPGQSRDITVSKEWLGDRRTVTGNVVWQEIWSRDQDSRKIGPGGHYCNHYSTDPSMSMMYDCDCSCYCEEGGLNVSRVICQLRDFTARLSIKQNIKGYSYLQAPLAVLPEGSWCSLPLI